MDRADGAANGRVGWREMLGLPGRLAVTPPLAAGGARRSQAGPDGDPYVVRSQAARGESSPRRYVGRAGAAGSPQSSGRAGVQPPSAPLEKSGSPGAAVMASPWSLRLVVAVSFVCLLALAVRVPGVTTTPVDLPAGV